MRKGYFSIQIRLRWIIAVLIGFQLIFGEDMGAAWRAVRRGTDPQMGLVVRAHIIVGSLVLALAVWRLVVRFQRGAPPAPDTGSAAMKMAGQVGHWSLYAVMVLAPVTGLLGWYGGIETATERHELTKSLAIVLITLHVVASLFHQFRLKDGLMARMVRSQDRTPTWTISGDDRIAGYGLTF